MVHWCLFLCADAFVVLRRVISTDNIFCSEPIDYTAKVRKSKFCQSSLCNFSRILPLINYYRSTNRTIVDDFILKIIINKCFFNFWQSKVFTKKNIKLDFYFIIQDIIII